MKKQVWIIDIETNDLLANLLDYTSFPYKLKSSAKMWCVVLTNAYTKEKHTRVKEEVTKEWLQETLKDCTHLVAHNGIKFDFIVLKLFGLLDYRVGYIAEDDTLFGNQCVFIDTLILSRLLNPDRYGGHSLDSWGERTGNKKTDFRQLCVDKGYIEKTAPRGTEFAKFCPEMAEYCEQDTSTNVDTFFALVQEMDGYKGWNLAMKMENKLADIAVRRESLGFFFDKELALECLEDLAEKMQDISDRVNPILPRKPMTKGELAKFTPPKNQFIKDGTPSASMDRFVERIGGELYKEGENYLLSFEGKVYNTPLQHPLKTHIEATIDNLDHVKMYLMELGWIPTEWRERDLTKDSKKQSIPFEKRVSALERWYKDTMNGKYQIARLEAVDIHQDYLVEALTEKLHSDFPVRVPTSPCVRVGVEKELCPNLIKLGDKVAFAKDFALYLTYKHRKSSIAGGDIEEMDFDVEYPNTGFLSMYRTEDGRVPTPAIELGSATNRYRHIGIANIPRASSVYGEQMRSLFGSGSGGVQFGYDFSSLEARIQGHYCWDYTDGQELAKTLLAEKPFDIHTVTGLKLGIPRSDAKSINYAILYGSSVNKLKKMLSCSMERAKEIYDGFWESVPALKELKAEVEKHWEQNDKKFIVGIDGRRINIRSKHSILNALFQSAGVISAKYVHVLSMKRLEDLGHCTDPFTDVPSVCSMIEYHDECQLFSLKKNLKYERFDTDEEAEEFVKAWDDVRQLSTISEGKRWYVALPNDISLAIEESIVETEEILKLNVSLGYEWSVSSNWFGCH